MADNKTVNLSKTEKPDEQDGIASGPNMIRVPGITKPIFGKATYRNTSGLIRTDN